MKVQAILVGVGIDLALAGYCQTGPRSRPARGLASAYLCQLCQSPGATGGRGVGWGLYLGCDPGMGGLL